MGFPPYCKNSDPPKWQNKSWQHAECTGGELSSAWGSRRRWRRVACKQPEETQGMKGGKAYSGDRAQEPLERRYLAIDSEG